MKQISFSSIEKAIQKIDNLDDDALEVISESFSKSQPTLLGYVMSAALEYKNEKLEGLLIYYFCLISDAFAHEGIEVREVTDEDIDAFEEPFFEMLDSYFDTDDDDILESFCDQTELARFMAMEISVEDEDGTTLDDETATQLFIVTMAQISLMSRAIKSAN
ncbi:MAG: hypothetical protein V4622_07025 [Bacteroidota bacterium]